MKNGLLKLLTVLLISATVFGGALLDYFHASSEGENVRLEWKTSQETNLKHFIIQRKSPQSDYIEIETILGKGDENGSFYSYIDESAYKPNDIVFIYRLKIVDNDGQSSFSQAVTVSHSISGVKRTWGSIKAMFR